MVSNDGGVTRRCHGKLDDRATRSCTAGSSTGSDTRGARHHGSTGLVAGGSLEVDGEARAAVSRRGRRGAEVSQRALGPGQIAMKGHAPAVIQQPKSQVPGIIVKA